MAFRVKLRAIYRRVKRDQESSSTTTLSLSALGTTHLLLQPNHSIDTDTLLRLTMLIKYVFSSFLASSADNPTE